jgi:hypothetical protein
METCVGREENALKITNGSGTTPMGASIKANKPDGKTLTEVGRLRGGDAVEV